MYNEIIKDINATLRVIYTTLMNDNPEMIRYFSDTDETFVLFPNNHAFNMQNLTQGFISAFSFSGRSEDFDDVLLYKTSSDGQHRGALDLYLDTEQIAQQFYTFTLDVLLGQFSESMIDYINQKESETEKEKKAHEIPFRISNKKPLN